MSGRPGLRAEAGMAVLGVLLLAAGHARGALRPTLYEPTPRTAGTVRVVTWNVGGEVAQGARALEPEFVDEVLVTLRELDPDLVLLQEIAGSRQLGDLRRGLGEGWDSVIARGGNGRRVAAFARTDDLERMSLDLPGGLDLPDGFEGRLLGVAFRTQEGLAVNAIALHANAFSAAERNILVGMGLEALVDVGRRRNGPLLVLAGDLNLDLDLDKRRDLFTNDSHLDVETYNYVVRYLQDAGRGRGATAEPDRRLDYVFVGPARFEVVAAGPWKGRRVGTMDHDPVVAEVRVPAGD